MASHHEKSYSERGNLVVYSVHKKTLLESVEISQGHGCGSKHMQLID